MSKLLHIQNFNLIKDDRVIVKKTSPFYGINKFYPANIEGIIVDIQDNCDEVSTQCPVYILWDNGQLAATTLQDIELVENERLQNRFVYEGDKLYFEDSIPATVTDVLPMLYSGSMGSAKSTFYRNEFGLKLHCASGKLRSFDDIYYLFNAYFPEETMKSVFERMLLYTVTKDTYLTNLNTMQLGECSTMKRIRYLPNSVKYSIKSIWDTAMTSSKYDSIIHWRELFKLIGVTSFTELAKWYAKQFEEPINKTI